MLKGTAREAAAELLGTFILIVFGVGVVAQTVLSKGENGSYLAINLGWGLAVMLGVYASGGVSGAHLNPAVTLALALTRGFPWVKVGPYVLAQMAGAFAGAAAVYFTYHEAFSAYDGGVRQVLGPQARPESSPPIPSRFFRRSVALSIRSSARRC
jgi:aquaglyceroporin related protein